MTEWTLVDVVDDPADDPAEDRWLLVYQVPSEYAPDGIYSVSVPKELLGGFAAAYGFDPVAEAEAAFDYLVHLPFMQEVARRQAEPFTEKGAAAQVSFNPYEMPASASRLRAAEHLDAFKKTHRIVANAPASQASGLVASGTARVAAKAQMTMLEAVRADMIDRVDPARAAEARQHAEAARTQVQERKAARAAARQRATAEAVKEAARE